MTENYMIPCGACGALLYLPVGQTTGRVPCACGGWADVSHALRHDDVPECLCVETYGATGTYTDECPTHSGH